MIQEALKHFEHDGYEIICYCLMDNHVHILIKTKDKPPGGLVGRINEMYAKYFNKKYNYIGHLFQARYHPQLVETDAQMLVMLVDMDESENILKKHVAKALICSKQKPPVSVRTSGV